MSRSFVNFFIIFFAIQIVKPIPNREFQLESGPIQVRAVSVNITETRMRSEIDCVTICQLRGCYAAVVFEETNICQVVMVSNATYQGSNSLVQKIFGSQTGARVWTAEVILEPLTTKTVPEPSTTKTVSEPSTTEAIPELTTTEAVPETRTAEVTELPQTATLPPGTNVSIVYRNTGTGRNGNIQLALINVTGCYRIEATGASGGAAGSFIGGKGALIAGNFSLSAGVNLFIVVGQMGKNSAACMIEFGAGGGGGSFVYSNSTQLLLAAGGGGGASCSSAGIDGRAGINGSNSSGSGAYTGIGGINGQPGFNNPSLTYSGDYHGGCGAGWLGKATNARRGNYDGERGGSLADGWVGGLGPNAYQLDGIDGGFGGGGSSGWGGRTASGAGGGYSGGGAAVKAGLVAGGGGSYCSGAGCFAMTGGNAAGSHGYVSLRLLSASCG